MNVAWFLLCDYFCHRLFSFRMPLSGISARGAGIATRADSHRVSQPQHVPRSANPLQSTSAHSQHSSLLLLAVSAGK